MNRVNFRDDTLLSQRKCCSEHEVSTTKDDMDLELGLPSHEDFQLDENQLTVMTLPAEFMRRPSMLSMKMKRDPLFQGKRARRNPRVIFKNGLRNISFKIPEGSLLFLKDFVTSLVRELKCFVSG